jgi:hypothetical protein
MRSLSLQRILAFGAVGLFAAQAFAGTPSARTSSKMVYDPIQHRMIMYGGETATDRGTRIAYDLQDTWFFGETRWVRDYPPHNPGNRGGHGMIWDKARSRVVLFGGRDQKTEWNDTWQFINGDWSKIDTATAPPGRHLVGMAYDSRRDRIVMFGGVVTTTNSAGVVTNTNLTDTWEFDGTNWTQRQATGPGVIAPELEYDAAHNQTIMVGVDDKFNALQYIWDPQAGNWNQVKPSNLPTCVDQSSLMFNPDFSVVMLTGGTCTSASADTEYEWDGTNWNTLSPPSLPGRVFGAAQAYDTDRHRAVMFGGTVVGGVPRAATFIYFDGSWFEVADATIPSPRSLAVFRGDPTNGTMWLYGGINETQSLFDFWQYQNGTWTSLDVPTDSGPTACTDPLGAYDTDRKKLVIVCASADTFEFDGTAWKKYVNPGKNFPPIKSFSALVYDPHIKKTVLYGGFQNPSYYDETWLWDGSTWTRVTKNPAPARDLTAMWFDPSLNRTVIYGGIGQPTSSDRIQRYSDMWSFDGTGWTQITDNAAPGPRYAAQVSVNPANGHAILFGGMRVTTTGTIQSQSYANDMWEWDGKTWTQLTPPTLPSARENGGFDYDPTTGQLTLFGGYAGEFLGDVWVYQNGNWVVKPEFLSNHRRAASH